MPQAQHKKVSGNVLKRGGISGIVVGVLALLACELPIIFAIIGFGGLSATALTFKPTPLVEMLAILLIVVGTFAIIFVWFKSSNRKKKARKM